MTMATQTVSGDVLLDMNTTPLIDVMLVLLTLLIITLPMQTHAIKLDMPKAGPAHPVPVVMLEIDFDGSAIWNGWRVNARTLARNLLTAARENPQPEIHMMANRLARYGAVADVMAATQRAGLTKIGLVDMDRY